MHQVWNCGVQIVERKEGRVSGEEDKVRVCVSECVKERERKIRFVCDCVLR